MVAKNFTLTCSSGEFNLTSESEIGSGSSYQLVQLVD